MTEAYLFLERVHIENANAIAGMTYGFPSVTGFLGFSHRLSRELNERLGICLGGCAIVAHDTQVHAEKLGGSRDFVFSLTRNPLNHKEKPPSFNEEGRMNLTVSLIIECCFTANDFDFGTGDHSADNKLLEQLVYERTLCRPMVGGRVVDVENVSFVVLPESQEKRRRKVRECLLQMLPGFALVDRTNLLEKHIASTQTDSGEGNNIAAWLDFIGIKSRAVRVSSKNSSEDKIEWEVMSKPAKGWLVPLQTGYRGISQRYTENEVGQTRALGYPFRFVESIYSVGEWVSPHRLNDIEEVMWRHHYDSSGEGWYLCRQG